MAAAVPAEAGLFNSDEYERPTPSGFTARAALLRQVSLTTEGLPAMSDDTALLAALGEVNRTVNRRPYVTDQENYGTSDHWATPAEFEARGGDCEDFAIAKYTLLKKMGVPAERMRVVVVRDLALSQQHAVLSVAVGDRHYILDNQSEQVLADSAIDHYRPVYSINERSWWLHMPTN